MSTVNLTMRWTPPVADSSPSPPIDGQLAKVFKDGVFQYDDDTLNSTADSFSFDAERGHEWTVHIHTKSEAEISDGYVAASYVVPPITGANIPIGSGGTLGPSV